MTRHGVWLVTDFCRFFDVFATFAVFFGRVLQLTGVLVHHAARQEKTKRFEYFAST